MQKITNSEEKSSYMYDIEESQIEKEEQDVEIERRLEENQITQQMLMEDLQKYSS